MDDTALIREKLAQATAVLDEYNTDLWLTFVRESSLQADPALALIFNGDVTWASAFLVSRSGEHMAIVGFYDADNVQHLDVYSQVVGYHQDIAPALREAIEKINPNRIAINYSETDVAADGLSVGMYYALQRILAHTPYANRMVSAETIIGAVRGRKTPQEVARIQQAVDTTEQLFDEVEAFVRPGMTQREIAAFVHGRVDGLGLGYAWPKPFNPIVTCGPDSAVGHAAPGDVVLQRGHTLHMDLGVKQDGFCSDLQRMWYVLDEGETEPPADVARAFDVVVKAIQAGEAALRPGTPGWEVDAAARRVIMSHGYAEFMHAFGHLLGRVAHDGATVLGPRWERYKGICERPVEVGNVFTLELHVQVPGRGVVSLEEDVLVSAEGVTYLSKPQTQLRLI